MLKKITLKNFRQHTDKVIDFQGGFNLIRGLNESGKSTVLAAAAYALYGSRSLPESLEQVVTWGEPVSSLKVTLDFEFAGVDYTIARGKSGAELKFGDELITGQTETVKFIENLFGINADVASKLMLANQGTIRGALEGGPKATMELIEALADFDIIENLIEKIQEKLPTGNTKIVEDRLKNLEAARAEEPVKPDVSALEEQVQAVQKEHDDLALVVKEAQEVVDRLRPAHEEFSSTAAKVAVTQMKVDNWPDDLKKLKTVVADAKKGLVADLLTSEQVQAAQTLIDQAASFAQLLAIHKQVGNLARPEVEWEGDLESFLLAKKQATAAGMEARKAISDLTADQKVLTARKITETACGLCGKDLSEVPEVVQKNAEIDKQLENLSSQITTLRAKLADVTEELEALEGIDTSSHTLIEKYSDYLDVNKNVVPWAATWKGAVPVLPDTTQAVADLKRHNAELQRVTRAQGAVEQAEKALNDELVKHEHRVAWLLEVADDCEKQRKEVQEPFTQALIKTQEGGARIKELAASLRDLNVTLREQLVDYTTKKNAYDVACANFGVAQKELEQMNFNNALIKKIRGARPKIADKLWVVVLSAVSHYFSSIRGKVSIVTKETSGFLVDGHPVTGLSGSTLDALGLAIRLALTKTFLPNVRFIVLDEAGAACDDQRETNMLGVLATCDFDQVLHVSHNDLGDAFANHVVQL